MPDFNPNSTNIAGLEWYPVRQLPRPLKQGAGTGFTFDATASESIATLVPWLESPNLAAVGIDVYDAADVGATVVGGLDIPAVDVAASAGFEVTSNSGASWAAYTTGIGFVDFAAYDIFTPQALAFYINGIGDWIRYKPTGSQVEGHLTWQGSGSYTKVTDGTAGNDPTGQRVGWIEVNIVAAAHNGSSPTIDSIIRLVDGVNYGSDDGPRRITPQWRRYTFHYYWNPATGRQWYSSDIAEFLSGGDNSFGISIRGKVPTEYWIAAVNIVWRSLDEKRVTTGYAAAPLTGGYASADALDPTDGSTATWSKASGTTYLVCCYLTGDGGSCTLNGLDQASLAENPTGALGGWVGADQPTYPGTAVPSAVGTTSTWAPSFLFQTAGPTNSVDCQPYAEPKVMRVHDTDTFGADSEQVAAHATDNYAMAQFVVGLFDENGDPSIPDDVLTVQIVNNVLTPVGGTIDVDPSEIPQDGRWHLLVRRLDSAAALSSGSTYYLVFSTNSTIPWSVAYADIVDSAAVGPAVEAGGTVNSVSGTTDLLSNVGTVPPPIANFQVTVGSYIQSPVAPGGPVNISQAILTWDASALGADFGYYEIRRGGYTIAKLLTEATVELDDPEVLRNAQDSYDMRVVRADGAPSDWTAEAFITVPTDGNCDFIISSLAAGQALGYQESGDANPVHSYARANSTLAVVHVIAGRQAPIAFRPLIEGDSDVFLRTLIVALDTAGAPVPESEMDRAAFDPLIGLIESTIGPYLTVCDGHGRRWYTFPEFQSGSYAWTGHEHLGAVKFTEVAGTPIPAIIP